MTAILHFNSTLQCGRCSELRCPHNPRLLNAAVLAYLIDLYSTTNQIETVKRVKVEVCIPIKYVILKLKTAIIDIVNKTIIACSG